MTDPTITPMRNSCELSAEQLKCLKQYLYGQSWTDRYNTYKAGKNGDMPDIMGKMAFELAVNAGSETCQEQLLGETREWVTWLEENPAVIISQRIADCIFSSNFPLMHSIYIDREHPDLDQIATAQKTLSWCLLDCFNTNTLFDNTQANRNKWIYSRSLNTNRTTKILRRVNAHSRLHCSTFAFVSRPCSQFTPMCHW